MQALTSKPFTACRCFRTRSLVAPKATRVAGSTSLHTVPTAQRAARSGGLAKHSRTAMKVTALFGLGTKTAEAASDFYNFEVKDIDGRSVKLNKYKGQVVLVVNLASQCGFTPQYADLASLYDKYSKQGFTILGFPCNQFGAQEPGSNNDIKRFAQTKYGVKFPLFAKVDVNGPAADPMFSYLKTEKGGILGNDIKWNFTKFLVDREGNVVGRYGSTTTPSQIESDIKKYI